MRFIRVTKDDVDETYTPVSYQASVTGRDPETAERVTFWMDTEVAMGTLELVARDGQADVLVAEHQILSVQSAGEWDSPGTSPE